MIYLPISIYGTELYQSFSIKAIARYIVDMLCVGQQWYSSPLWYLLSSTYAVLFFLLMIKLGCKRQKIFAASIVVYLASFIVTYIGENAGAVGLIGFASKLIEETFGSGRVFSGIGYMAFGMIAANNERYLSRKISVIILTISAVASLILFKAEVMFTETPLLIIPAYAAFCIGRSYFCIGRSYSGNTKKQIYEFFRKANTSIYFTHMIFFFFGGLFFWGFNGAARYGLIEFLGTSVLSTVFAIIAHMNRKNELLNKILT